MSEEVTEKDEKRQRERETEQNKTKQQKKNKQVAAWWNSTHGTCALLFFTSSISFTFF